MAHLNLHDEKKFHTVEIRDKTGQLKSFKIPIELTVAETERMLALYEEVDKLQDEPIQDESAQLRYFWEKMFGMATILFQHFQPEIDEQYLRENLTSHDVLTLSGFFQNNRYLKLKEQEDEKKALAD